MEMRNNPVIFDQGEEDDQERGKRSLEIGGTLREQNSGYDNVEDEKEDQGTFYSTRIVDDQG